MKLSIRTPDGKSKTRECEDKDQIKIMLARGWKEEGKSKVIKKKKTKK